MMENIDKRIIDKGFHTGYEVDFVTIQQSDYEYLKEQAERVQEYEYTQKYEDELIKQNKRYHEALEFYAEQDNYGWETSYRPQQEIDCMVIDDGGHTARKALEDEE